jgi:hypothetical protein
MSIGSSFDAYAKSYLHEKLFGKGHDPRFELTALFEEQVEVHNRDWAWKHGALVFKQYQEAGCLADLMLELNSAIGDPRFEFDIQDTITTDIGDVPLLGKPDIFFINSLGARVVYDWKVNGYCAQRNTSPMKGYVKLRTKKDGSWTEKSHPSCVATTFKGIMINAAMCLEEGKKDWAGQLAIYSWLLGEEIGSEEMVFGIDQVCGPAIELRFASHRLRISPQFQYDLVDQVKIVWDSIQNKHIFRDMSIDASRERCEMLEMAAKGGSLSAEDQADFNSVL